MKAQTLSKLQQAARDDMCRLIYLDEAGFSASAPVQRGSCVFPRMAIAQ